MNITDEHIFDRETIRRTKGDRVGNRSVKGYIGILLIAEICRLPDVVGTDLIWHDTCTRYRHTHDPLP